MRARLRMLCRGAIPAQDAVPQNLLLITHACRFTICNMLKPRAQALLIAPLRMPEAMLMLAMRLVAEFYAALAPYERARAAELRPDLCCLRLMFQRCRDDAQHMRLRCAKRL